MADDWSRVKWSEARQIVRRLGRKAEAAGPKDGVAPKAYFEQLRAEGRLDDAAEFLGQALPRYEAVAWAARTVRDLRDADDRSSPEAAALKAALLWLQDPTESRRRAAAQAAETAESDAPERIAAMAAFASGGSMAPADFDPVPAPRELAGTLAAAAVSAVVGVAPDREAALNRALDAGAMLAGGDGGSGGGGGDEDLAA